uniref:Putative LOV domain-containing protein n=1 Tax=Senega lutea TaxID=174542 RepID=A0A126X046_9FABA|nr:putative LOV domain-containing protein [Polygala lutea]
MESQLGLSVQSLNQRYSYFACEALDELPESFTITDPCLPGHPIVFASSVFLKMSGYSMDEVIGKNGRVFQGPRTCRRSVMEIREAIREERMVMINLLNYRKDGTPFWMLFHMCPVFSKDDGRVIHFVAVQIPISRKARLPGSNFRRNGVHLSEDGSSELGFVFGSCRREVCSDSVLELSCSISLDSLLDTDIGEGGNDGPCEASDGEKKRATTTMNNIFSILTHYSEVNGRLVSSQRSGLPRTGLLCSSLNISLGRIKQSFVLTDPHLHDTPIVYASVEFLRLTGYTADEVLGHNCRFLSGNDTDSLTLDHIRESIKSEQACTVRILNYRKDKTTFWNLLHISPVRNASGKVAFFVGVHIEEDHEKLEKHGLSPETRQRSVVGAVKVAVRCLSIAVGASKSSSFVN